MGGIHVNPGDHDAAKKANAVHEVIRFILSSAKVLVKALKAFDTFG